MRRIILPLLLAAGLTVQGPGRAVSPGLDRFHRMFTFPLDRKDSNLYNRRWIILKDRAVFRLFEE